MKSVLRSGALAAALVVGGAATASAQFSWSGCGGSNFNTCASVSITEGAGNTLILTLQNWGNWDPNLAAVNPSAFGSIFTTIGLSNIGTTLTGLVSAVCTNDATCSWEFDGDISSISEGPDGPYDGASRTSLGGAGVDNGLNPPTTPGTFTQVVFTFSTSTNVTNAQLVNADFGIHGQDGPESCSGSTKLFVTGTNGVGTPNVNTSCEPGDPNTAVPEPATMGLLALGLVGMGGASLIRRRRKV